VAQVIWSDRALADIEAVVAYIVSQHSPIAAQRLAQRLMAAGDALEANPDRGRTISRGRRELAVVAPYLIRYQVREDAIWILEVRHGARRPD
jgi:hypothetical protein